MFAALRISDRSRVTSIAARWDENEEALRELARVGLLVCPGCEQKLWLKTSSVRRRHFAHRDLSDCSVGDESPEVLEAKAQLFTWLDTKFPDRVQIDLDPGTPGESRVADLVADPADGKRFIYWIFDRQIRDRSEFRTSNYDGVVKEHYIHTESTLKLAPDGGIILSPSQRDFINRGDFDRALPRPGSGHLHFILGTQSRVRVYRGLHCVHSPAVHEWGELREASLERALVCPKSGEIVFDEDVEARAEWRQRPTPEPARTPPKKSDAKKTARRTSRSRIIGTPPPASMASNPLSRPFRCEECGIETTAWSRVDLSQGTCVCNQCLHQRWLRTNPGKQT